MTSARIASSQAGIVIGFLALVIAASQAHARPQNWGSVGPIDGYWSHIDVPEIARLGPGDTGRPTGPKPGMEMPTDDLAPGMLEPGTEDFGTGLSLWPTRSGAIESDWGSIAAMFYDVETFGFEEISLVVPAQALQVKSAFQPTIDLDLGTPGGVSVAAPDWGMTVPAPGAAGILAAAAFLMKGRRRR